MNLQEANEFLSEVVEELSEGFKSWAKKKIKKSNWYAGKKKAAKAARREFLAKGPSRSVKKSWGR